MFNFLLTPTMNTQLQFLLLLFTDHLDVELKFYSPEIVRVLMSCPEIS